MRAQLASENGGIVSCRISPRPNGLVAKTQRLADSMGSSPECLDRVFENSDVGGRKKHLVLNGLADQHAIEGIAVMLRQFGQMSDGRFFERQGIDRVALSLRRNVARRGLRQREFS